jgi:hypothetical protein
MRPPRFLRGGLSFQFFNALAIMLENNYTDGK